MGDQTTPSISLDAELVETIYETALRPDSYDDLMDMWRLQIEAAVLNLGEREDEVASHTDLINVAEGAKHFETAYGILEAMGRDADKRMVAHENTRGAAKLIINSEDRIVWFNGIAAREFGVSTQSSIDTLPMTDQGKKAVRNAFQVDRNGDKIKLPEKPFLVVLESKLTGRAMHMVAAPAPNLAEESSLLLQQAGSRWQAEVGSMMATGFGLSAAEVEIVAGLVDGHDLNEIASQRDRKVSTVRTQLKAILKKTATRSQNELIRLCLSLATYHPEARQKRRPVPSNSIHRFTLKNDRNISYHFFGPRDGRPVFFIHGMLDGIQCMEVMETLLFEHNVKLIGIERPAFGSSDTYEGAIEDLLDYFASCAEELIDHLGIKRLVICGHMSGALFAFAVAARLQGRVQAVVNISGGVPITSVRQIRSMSVRQRLIAYTARYTPSALPFMLRAGIKQLDTGGDRKFIKALYQDSPLDFEACQDPEVFDLISNGYHFSVIQGHRAFELDAYHVVRDWSQLVGRSACPVYLVHGHQDPVVKWETVQSFAASLGERANVRARSDSGQLIYYHRPKFVFDVFQEALAH